MLQKKGLQKEPIAKPPALQNEDDVIKKTKERAEKFDKASCMSWRSRVSERSDGYREIGELEMLGKMLQHPRAMQKKPS
jgi:hypothetical protein